MVTVPTFMQEMRATVSALSNTVKSLEDRVIRSQGQFTKTTLLTLRSRLDLLEGRTTQVPQVLVEEPPPAHPPESTVPPPPPPAVLPDSQKVSETRTSTHHSVLPVVLPLDPPDDSVTPPPRVPPERVHHPTPQSHLASPGFNTGNPGPHAPMAGTPNPLINSRAAYAALRARMSHEAASKTMMAHGYPVGQPTRRTLAAPLLHRRASHLDGMSHRIRLPPPNPPNGTDNPPFVNLSSVVASISTVTVMAVLVATTIITVTPPLTSVATEITTTPMAMSPSWGGPSFPLDTVTGPCMPARWVLVVLT